MELIKRDRIGKDLKYKLSNRKLKKQFRFKFKTSMNTGLKHVDDWIIDNRSILFKEKTWYVHKKWQIINTFHLKNWENLE